MLTPRRSDIDSCFSQQKYIGVHSHQSDSSCNQKSLCVANFFQLTGLEGLQACHLTYVSRPRVQSLELVGPHSQLSSGYLEVCNA